MTEQPVAVVTGASIGASGVFATDVTVPNDAQLVGVTLYWQGAFADGGQLSFGGNVQSMTVQ